jgi:hypothetical protein
VLARRERVDALRPFAFEDTDQDARAGAEPHRPRPPRLPRPLRSLRTTRRGKEQATGPRS